MATVITIALALASIFFFPTPITILLAAVASYMFIPMGLIIGLLYDATYGLSGGIALGTLFGAGVSVFCFFTQKFVRDRISLS